MNALVLNLVFGWMVRGGAGRVQREKGDSSG
jgi:hypothetical protein